MNVHKISKRYCERHINLIPLKLLLLLLLLKLQLNCYLLLLLFTCNDCFLKFSGSIKAFLRTSENKVSFLYNFILVGTSEVLRLAYRSKFFLNIYKTNAAAKDDFAFEDGRVSGASDPIDNRVVRCT